jgi:hypothetical protein
VFDKFPKYLAVNKQRTHRFHLERFNLKKLNEVESCVEISNRVVALEDLDAEVELNNAWEIIRENIKISAKESLGYCEMTKHKPWFDQACIKGNKLKCSGYRIQVK